MRISAAFLVAFAVMVGPASFDGLVLKGGGPQNPGIVLEETETGFQNTDATTVSSGVVTANAGDTYLALISTNRDEVITSVAGVGLTWFEVEYQCGGRGFTAVAIYEGTGTPTSDGTVVATFSAGPNASSVTVTRWSGVSDVSTEASANSNGVDGACSGGSDQGLFSESLTTVAANSEVLVIFTPRNRNGVAGAGYTQVSNIATSSGNGSANAVVQHREFPTAGAQTVDGDWNANADWAMIAVELEGL